LRIFKKPIPGEGCITKTTVVKLENQWESSERPQKEHIYREIFGREFANKEEREKWGGRLQEEKNPPITPGSKRLLGDSKGGKATKSRKGEKEKSYPKAK